MHLWIWGFVSLSLVPLKKKKHCSNFFFQTFIVSLSKKKRKCPSSLLSLQPLVLHFDFPSSMLTQPRSSARYPTTPNLKPFWSLCLTPCPKDLPRRTAKNPRPICTRRKQPPTPPLLLPLMLLLPPPPGTVPLAPVPFVRLHASTPRRSQQGQRLQRGSLAARSRPSLRRHSRSNAARSWRRWWNRPRLHSCRVTTSGACGNWLQYSIFLMWVWRLWFFFCFSLGLLCILCIKSVFFLLLLLLQLFRHLLNISVEFSAEEFETALLTPNDTLSDIHMPLLKVGAFWFFFYLPFVCSCVRTAFLLFSVNMGETEVLVFVGCVSFVLVGIVRSL